MLRPSDPVTRGPERVIGAPNAVIPSNARDLGFCSTRTTPMKETKLPRFAREDKPFMMPSCATHSASCGTPLKAIVWLRGEALICYGGLRLTAA